MKCSYVQGSAKHRRWMKKNLSVKNDAFDRELVQFERRMRGWIWVWDETDRVSYAHHWLDGKPVIHKGRKP